MHLLIAGGTRADRLTAAQARERDHPGRARLALHAASLPFTRVERLSLPPPPRLVRIDDIELAFPNHQSGGIRLVLTQSTYLVQKLIDRLGPEDVIVATADLAALERNASEAIGHRGAWRWVENVPVQVAGEKLAASVPLESPSAVSAEPFVPLLASAFASSSPDQRHGLCRQAGHDNPRSEVCALSLASACREIDDADGARAALDAALQLAPDWEAAHFEDGKFWLAADDMAQARDAFARAGMLMPTFSAAFSNLGATLGELDDPDGAAAAFQHALQHDPDNFTLLNNIGVMERERGRLAASEEVLARVTTLTPEFVFGHYNLGHTRFLRADYAGALAAYEEGWRRDLQKNRRQGCRLALVRFANGRVDAAEREFWGLADSAPPDEREELLLEAYEIGSALLQAHPQLASNRRFIDRIGAALTL
jgi:tetratricopeptide (TPR) repeat protein